MYIKIAKYVSWALLIIGALICVLGYVIGFNVNNAAMVDTLLYFGYCMLGAAVLAIIILGIYTGALINPKGLITAIIVVVAALVILYVVYLISPGNTPVGYYGVEQTKSTLKLTDTILILTYAFCGGAILAVIVGAIVNAVRK